MSNTVILLILVTLPGTKPFHHAFTSQKTYWQNILPTYAGRSPLPHEYKL